MLDLWRDIQHEKAKNNSQDHPDRSLIMPHKISYRATNPLYAGEDYEIVLREDGKSGSVNIFNQDGVLSMKAEIQS
jgi:hydroxyacyl-ACP dehydratase HTD2-like protein with hotdog domain